jgi:hypothetical protein
VIQYFLCGNFSLIFLKLFKNPKILSSDFCLIEQVLKITRSASLSFKTSSNQYESKTADIFSESEKFIAHQKV